MPPLAFGLNTTKKSGPSKPAAPKRKPAFGAFGGNDSDDEDAGANTSGAKVQEIEIGGDLDDFDTFAPPAQDTSRKQTKPKNGVPSEPPKLKPKTGQPNTMFGDLSSSLTSRRAAEEASTLDSSVYEYDSVYDSLKPAKPTAAADKDRRPKYMRGLMEAADVRKRDALIAEEKKIAREREEEGDEYAGKEKFVTEAYRKQQEENKRIEEEERRREEEESKKNAGGGMSGFYKDLLKREGQRHDEVVQAAQETAKEGPKEETEAEVVEDAEESRRVKELQDKGADVAVNEEGQVVDKRQLLKGGLNLGAKPTKTKQQQDSKPPERDRRPLSGQQIGSRQAQRERQSRMMAEQLEASMKRNREEEEAQRQEVERQAKSRKTEGEISSAKERYLARKKAAEEAKQKGDS